MSNLGKTLSLVLVLISLTSLVTLQPTSVKAQSKPTWNTQLVDPKGDGGSIALDAQNNPHIVYGTEIIVNDSSFSDGMYYAVRTGLNWSIQTVDIDPSAGGGLLLLDSFGHPHIIYKVGNTLKYAVLNGENWDIQAIDVSDSDIGYSMALDSNGNPHVVYSKFNDSLKSNTRDSYFGDIKYAVFDGTNWLLETIDSIELSSFYYSNISPSITLDSSNDPHIMYANTFEHQFYDKNIIPSHLGSESLHNVKYATWKESKWLVQTILTNTSRISNLVLDSKGQPSFCYERGNLPESGSFQTSSLMNYAYLDGQVWLSRVIDSNPSPSSPTLNLDSNNNPQVYFYHENYQNPNDEGLICARWNSFGWSTQNLGSIPPNSFYQYTAHINDFAFNSNGSLGLTYYGEVGTIRGAAVWGGLTYASLESASSNSTGSQNPSLFVLSPKQIIIIIVVVLAVAVIAALLYRRHRHECLR